ncbi:MAG: ABC transporter substrate-binding protein [Thalassobaculaceae bacterium]
MRISLPIIAGAALTMVGMTQPAQAETKVGLLLPKSGTYAVLGKEIEAGFNLALEQAGRTGEFTIVGEDTEIKPAVGLAKARKLVLEDEVDVIVGIVSSGVLGALRNFVDGAKVPLIVANAGNDKATGESCSPYIVRVSFSNSQINRPMGPWMVKQGIKKVYTLAPDYAAGHQMIEAFTTSFKAAGGEIVGGEFTPFRKTKDFGPYLTKAKAANPDGIFVFYAGGEAISFVKQYGTFGLAPQYPLFGSGFLTSSLYVKAEGDAAIGVKTALHYAPTLKTPENAAFVKAFAAEQGRPPSEFAVQGYDAARLLMGAVDAGASGREALAKALPRVKYVGPRGPMQIDPATNNVVQNIYVYETVKADGKLTQKVIDTIEGVRDAPNGCSM